MSRKERITVTLDRDIVEVANQAVAAGRASSLSNWVNSALAEHAQKERRLRALAAAIADYEAEFGEITDAEIEEQRRADRRNAIVVRGGRVIRRPKKTVRRARKAA